MTFNSIVWTCLLKTIRIDFMGVLMWSKFHLEIDKISASIRNK